MLEKNVERLIGQLLTLIEQGSVIPVIGPELLALEINGKTTQLYTYLAEQLALRLQLDPEPDDGLNAVVCRYLSQGRKRQAEDIYPELRSVLAEMPRVEFPLALIKLAEIRQLQLFVTTTFDPFLVQALNHVRYAGKEQTRVIEYYPGSIQDLPLALKDLHRTTVFHLFGKLDQTQSFAVTDEDVLEFMHTLQAHSRPERLFDALLSQNLMVIGCPLFDWLGRFFVRIVNLERLINSKAKATYLVGNQLAKETNLAEFLENFTLRTQVLPLASLEFINELHSRWQVEHPPEPFTNMAEAEHAAEALALSQLESLSPAQLGVEINEAPTMHNGAVFLSYAHEDQPSVMLIRDAFEKAGIEVWFDKNPEALRAGDHFDSRITSNIEKCALFLPIISQHTLIPKPRYFRKEWKYAQQRALGYPDNMRFIIPVAIDDTPPDADNLDEPLRKLHWERVPGGQCSLAFLNEIKELQRIYRRNNP
jgi:hypothetical protein